MNQPLALLPEKGGTFMTVRRTLGAAFLAAAVLTAALHADEPRQLTDAEFVKLHRLIKPRPGESRWNEIDWHPSVWEARQKAAAEGKPIVILAGSGGAPAAGC
jgi:hypothetical protein